MSGSRTPVWQVAAGLPLVRWVTCAVLWVAVLAVWIVPHLDVSLRAIAPLGWTAAICRTLVTMLTQRRGDAPAALRGLAFAAETGLLTGLLDITGGPFNPFIVMYAAYIWLAAVTLSVPWAVVVAVVSAAGFGWLVFDHVQAELAEHHRLNDFPAHLFTMWLSGAVVYELVAHYVTRARAVLSQQQRQLDETRERALRSGHLAALTTLAAGAAHELSTPLGTIAVAARELERRAESLRTSLPAVAPLHDDARLIRQEVDRCQVILDGMSGRAPDGSGTHGDPLPPAAIAELVRARLPQDQQQRLEVDVAPATSTPAVAGAALAQAIAALLKNAFDASDAHAPVQLRFSEEGSIVRVEVRDRGVGMAPDVQGRAGQPFYSTKAAGGGLGLGVFLTRAFAEQAGGALRFVVADGTTAILELPVVGQEAPRT